MKKSAAVGLAFLVLHLFITPALLSLTPREESSLEQALRIGYMNLLYLDESFLPAASRWDQADRSAGVIGFYRRSTPGGNYGALDFDLFSFSPVAACYGDECEDYTTTALGLSYRFTAGGTVVRYGGSLSFFGVDSRPESVSIGDAGGLQERISVGGNIEYRGFRYALTALAQHINMFDFVDNNGDTSAVSATDTWEFSSLHEIEIPFGLYSRTIATGAEDFDAIPYAVVGERILLPTLNSLVDVKYEVFDGSYGLYGLAWDQRLGRSRRRWPSTELSGGVRLSDSGSLYSYRLGVVYRAFKAVMTHQLRDLRDDSAENVLGVALGAGIHIVAPDRAGTFLFEVVYSRNYLTQLEIVGGAENANYLQLKIRTGDPSLLPPILADG